MKQIIILSPYWDSWTKHPLVALFGKNCACIKSSSNTLVFEEATLNLKQTIRLMILVSLNVTDALEREM